MSMKIPRKCDHPNRKWVAFFEAGERSSYYRCLDCGLLLAEPLEADT